MYGHTVGSAMTGGRWIIAIICLYIFFNYAVKIASGPSPAGTSIESGLPVSASRTIYALNSFRVKTGQQVRYVFQSCPVSALPACSVLSQGVVTVFGLD